jgi:hypothetical protein
MKVIFNELAGDELSDAECYYNIEHPGSGAEFKKEIKKAIERVRKYPLAFPIVNKEIRTVILHRYPYKILYSIELDHIYIIAIAHQHRRPEYWVGRI